MFTSAIGNADRPRNVTREFQAMLTIADVPRVRFHDLRHTAATLLPAQGVAPRTTMEISGHGQMSLDAEHVSPRAASTASGCGREARRDPERLGGQTRGQSVT